MKQLNELKPGDEVALLQKQRDGKFKPMRRVYTVTKVTKVILHVGSEYTFTLTDGLPYGRNTYGLRVSTDPDVINWAREELRCVMFKAAEKESERIARNARPTYQLACQLIDAVEPEKSIADFELLGESVLQQLIVQIKQQKQ